MKPVATIYVGTGATYLCVAEMGGFAVFSKTLPEEKTTWIIAKRPVKIGLSIPQPPASVTQEFITESAAVDALRRWASVPQPSKPLKRFYSAVERLTQRSGIARPSKNDIGAGQLNLPLQ